MAQLQINTKKKAAGLSKDFTYRELKQVKRACNRAIGRVKAGKELPVDIKRELTEIGLDPATVTLKTLEALRENAIGARALIRDRKAMERQERSASPERTAKADKEVKPEQEAATVPSEPKAATVPNVLPQETAPQAEESTASKTKKTTKKTTKKAATKNPAVSLTRKKKASKKAKGRAAAQVAASKGSKKETKAA